jgi:hypothetical protein
MHAAGPIQGSTAGATSTVMTPAEIKGWLDAGGFTIAGHQEISGHRAVGLWLSRTTSLLDMVNHVHIPAGFRQVAPPR